MLLVNQNPYPVLVQAWVDDGALDGEPDTALAPFLPLPPVFRLEPGRQRSLRLLATGQAQARDRESLYWLNIYEIPASHRRGRWPARLTVTLRTQMKVLYRPHGLHPHAEDAAAELGFALRDETLRVDNPTPYFVSLAGLALEIGRRAWICPERCWLRARNDASACRGGWTAGRAARWRSTGSTTTASAARKGKLYSEQFPTGSPARAPTGRCRLPGRRPAPRSAFPGRPGERSGAPGLAGRYGMPGIRNGSRSTGKPCSGSRPPAASRRCRPRN